MLTNQRHEKILEILDEKETVTVSQLSRLIGSSDSTIRRDLIILQKENKLKKVFGGATKIKNSEILVYERNNIEKFSENIKEKKIIAKYACSLIKNNECIYIDAGTTTSLMIDNIHSPSTLFITNGIEISKKLTEKNLKCILLGGNLKLNTDSIIGQECINMLRKFNFTKGFFGTNGITKTEGFTTHDINEANVKNAAISKCKEPYILADSTKFGKIFSISFADINDCKIITYNNKFKLDKTNTLIDIKNK